MAAATGLLALTLTVHAQWQRPHERAGSVTILTDGIAEPNSRATRAINELAKEIGNVRVLPIAGHGAAVNVRDLVQLRGVDLAVLNSDIFLFLDQTRQSPAARDHIRHVAHMYNQKVYLLARKEFRTIKDFRGRKLGVLSTGTGSHTTATTLFGLLNINVALHALGSDAHLDDATLERLDGVLLLSDELARVRLSAQARQGLRILPIGLTPAMRGAYRPAVIEPQELPGLAVAANTETIAVSTLLAAYNWKASQARFADVSKFWTGLSSALPKLHQNAGSVWQQADINAKIEGWARHGAAQPRRAPGKAQPAAPALTEEPTGAIPPAAPALAEETTAAIPPAADSSPAPVAAQPTKITVLAMGRAPLADERLPEGGLIPELLRSSLGKARPGGAGLDIELRWTMATPVKSLLSDASVDISLPWDGTDCERPNDLVQASAVLCDNAVYSDPILDVVVGLFTRSDSNFRFDTDESIFGRTICISGDQDVSLLNGLGRGWLSQKRVMAVRQPTLLDCVSAVQTQEVDAFVASDLEGRYVLDRLGLSGHFRMAERQLGIRGVHAVASREHAYAPELIAAVNRGLKELKASGAYATIVRSHLTRLWNARAGTP
jgi:ABC-type amino acid transport substrate-binding protein